MTEAMNQQRRLLIDTISKKWGMPVIEVLPGAISSNTLLKDPMQWDLKILQHLSQIAKLCPEDMTRAMINTQLSEEYFRRIKDPTQPRGLQIRDTEATLKWLWERQAQHVGKGTKAPSDVEKSTGTKRSQPSDSNDSGPDQVPANAPRKVKVNRKVDAETNELLVYDQPSTTKRQAAKRPGAQRTTTTQSIVPQFHPGPENESINVVRPTPRSKSVPTKAVAPRNPQSGARKNAAAESRLQGEASKAGPSSLPPPAPDPNAVRSPSVQDAPSPQRAAPARDHVRHPSAQRAPSQQPLAAEQPRLQPGTVQQPQAQQPTFQPSSKILQEYMSMPSATDMISRTSGPWSVQLPRLRHDKQNVWSLERATPPPSPPARDRLQ